MNIKEYVLRNPAIEHNIRAVVRLNMLKKRIENGTYKLRNLDSKKEIEGIDEKINANLELLKKYVANSHEDVDYNELLEGINKLGNSISEKYDGTKSFKENFYNQLENMENDIATDIDKGSKDAILDDDKDDKEKDDSEKDDEEKDDEETEIDETINTVDKLTINYSLKDDAFICDAPDCETEIKKVPFKLYENNVEDQKRIYGDDYNFIFGEFDEKQLKYMDSRLVFLLWQKMGKEEAKNYLSEFVKGKDADKSKLNYEMVYDVNDIKNETELSKEEKKHLLKNLSYYRKKSELDKIFSSTNRDYGINILLELELDKELELNNLSKVLGCEVDSSIAIWSLLGVEDIYPFNRNEHDLIDKIKIVMQLNNMDPVCLYTYGLYVNSCAAKIKGLDLRNINEAYNSLIIKSRHDIDIDSNDIMKSLDREPGKYIKDIYSDVEKSILYKRLGNNKEEIINYIKNNYGNR